MSSRNCPNGCGSMSSTEADGIIYYYCYKCGHSETERLSRNYIKNPKNK